MASYFIWYGNAFGGGENVTMIILCLVGIISGIISGMGIGGGTILIPALVMLTDLSQQAIQGINLIYFIPTAVTALFVHAKKGNVEKKIIKPIILFGIAGAVAGSLIAVNMDSNILRKVFAVFLIIMGISELRKK